MILLQKKHRGPIKSCTTLQTQMGFNTSKTGVMSFYGINKCTNLYSLTSITTIPIEYRQIADQGASHKIIHHFVIMCYDMPFVLRVVCRPGSRVKRLVGPLFMGVEYRAVILSWVGVALP